MSESNSKSEKQIDATQANLNADASAVRVLRAELRGRDFVEVTISGTRSKWTVVGCTELLDLVTSYKQKYSKLSQWPLPEGDSHSQMLLREILQKFHRTWDFPYKHAEICHCRAVPTFNVDQAVLAGALTAEQVSRQTSASLACGTCRPDVQQLIDFRVGKKTAS